VQLAAELGAVRGIGSWTSSYIAQRAIPTRFSPPIYTCGELSETASAARPRRCWLAPRGWQPWRAYAVIYLWLGSAPPARARS
jgi:3-methyladenine DNA glycosylase/8-oxoguanine DNA glycosylase